MIGRASIISPMLAGTVSRKASRIPRASVDRKSSWLPSAMFFASSGSVTVPMATPKIPSGSCMRRNALFSHVTEPAARCVANEVLTITFTCTALAAITAGAINRSTVFTPSSRQLKSRRGRKPMRKSGGICTASWRNPPMSVPTASPNNARVPKCGSSHQPIATPPRMEPMLKNVDAIAGQPNTSFALSIPMASAASETMRMNGNITAVSIAVVCASSP